MAASDSLLERFLILPGLALTSAVSVALIYGDATGTTSSGNFYQFTVKHRASVQIIVQILSHLFGACLVLVLTSLINFRTRLYLNHSDVSLHHLRWWNQLCNRRPVWTLPWTLALSLLLFYIITLIPAALWAGAITPVTTLTPTKAITNIPRFARDPDGHYLNQTKTNWEAGASNTTSKSYGDFSFFPAFPFGGRILSTASSATPLNNVSNQTHEKFDKTRYSFYGRSYGVGSSVGLPPMLQSTDPSLQDPHITDVQNLARYSFEEIGYNAQVSCIKNQSSQWNLRQLYFTGYEGVPVMYEAAGTLPNSDFGVSKDARIGTTFSWAEISLAQFGYFSDVAMAAIGAVSGNGRNVLALTSIETTLGLSSLPHPTSYFFLNQTQCEVSFKPRTFLVSADVDQRLINVTDIGGADESVLDPSVNNGGEDNFPPAQGILVQMVMRQTMLLSASLTTLFTSVVGDAFVSNVKNEYQRLNVPLNNFSNHSINMAGIEHAFESILDGMLLGVSGAQLALTNGTGVRNATVKATIHAVKIGQSVYIYAVAMFNFATLAFYIFEAVRTRGWHRLEIFDYTNLTSLVMATLIGGKSPGEQATERHAAATGYMRVRLTRTEEGFMLTTADGDVVQLRSMNTSDAESIPLVDMKESYSGSFTPISPEATFSVPRKPLMRTIS